MPLAHTPKRSGSSTDALSSQKTPPAPHNIQPSPTKQAQLASVRRSIGEWESCSKPSTSKAQSRSPSGQSTTLTAPTKQKLKIGQTTHRRTSVEIVAESPQKTESASCTIDRVREGRNLLVKAKTYLGESRNLKSDLKTGIIQALDRLFLLLKEEAAKIVPVTKEVASNENKDLGIKQGLGGEGQELLKLMREHTQKLDRTQAEMEKLKDTIALHHTSANNTYAQMAATQPARQSLENRALHSIVVTSKNESHRGEDVMNEVRKAVNAKDGWVTVERIRKVRDRKVIIGCRTEEERNKVKERLKSADGHLDVEEMKNQDPMLTLKDVLNFNSDEDIVKALRSQNGEVFHGLDKKDDRVVVKFKRRARNPLTNHVTVRVSPQIYNRMLAKGAVHIDMQRVRVVDQSPLVQCSMCLAYGHGRRFCVDTTPKCSHCGGPHMRSQCADFLATAPPTCCNCMAAKMDSAGHNAFSSDCPVRKRWDALARAKVAYC